MIILGEEIPLVLVLITFLVLWFIRYAFFGFDFFSKQGIPTVQPILPVVGNVWKVWKRDNMQIEVERLRIYGKLYGMFEGKNPIYVTSDPEIIKAVTVKEFDNFVDRRGILSKTQKYVRKFLSDLHGQDWKDVRNGVSPVFSSGKIKWMSRLMEECCESLVKVTADRATKNDGLVELRELYGMYTLDVIASCAFGTKIDALDDPKNIFIMKTKKFIGTVHMNSPLILIPLLFPWIAKLGIKFLSEEDIKFFADVVTRIIATRRAEKHKRGDVLDVMIEEMDNEAAALRNDPTKEPVMTEEVVVAQSIIFFLAGFETTASVLAMACHYLALEPEIQDRLAKEISASITRNEGKISHEMIADCGYLDQVLSETLRIAAPPIRFSPENKSKIKPFTYLPFGNGARNCIGMRFAQEEAKLALATMVHNFSFLKCQKTNVPNKVVPHPFVVKPVDLYVKIVRRC
ncbi:unnamed protein product [Notodromas monacha]|uniref:Cytochrome P450 n=1 Tax=Notodromas monacha TaxID=399045 RepID=A0A7R9C1H8_9CRUS|nr:unnamed protein product [Notodromas monacha]CAG0924441.1 unnamed protein product [Notodromas monacha]